MAYDKVVDSAQLNAALTATANAIREKAGNSDACPWDASTGFASLIAAIQAGGSDVKFATGIFTIGDADVATIEVEHNLGVCPNFVFFMYDQIHKNASSGLTIGMMAQRADGTYDPEDVTPTPRYSMSRTVKADTTSSTISHAYSASGSLNAFYGIKDITKQKVVFGYNETYPLMAGRSFSWICAVIATYG